MLGAGPGALYQRRFDGGVYAVRVDLGGGKAAHFHGRISVHLPGRDLLQHREVLGQRVHGAGECGRRVEHERGNFSLSCRRDGADGQLHASQPAGKPDEWPVLAGYVRQAPHAQAVGGGDEPVGIRADGVSEAFRERHREGLSAVRRHPAFGADRKRAGREAQRQPDPLRCGRELPCDRRPRRRDDEGDERDREDGPEGPKHGLHHREREPAVGLQVRRGGRRDRQ